MANFIIMAPHVLLKLLMILHLFLLLVQLNTSHSFAIATRTPSLHLIPSSISIVPAPLPFDTYISSTCTAECVRATTKSALHYTNHNTNTDNDIHSEYDVRNKIAAINAIPLSLNKKQIMSLPSNERYQYRIKQLLHHNQTHGTLDIPYNCPDDPQLAKWVITQRYEYKLLTMEKIGVKSYLTPERVELLNAIQFPWDRENAERAGLTKRWMTKWELLKAYQEEYGHVQIPESCIYRGAKLGVWLNNQQKSAWTQPDDIKTKLRVKTLNELGFLWDTREYAKKKDTLYNALWMERYQELKECYLQHGHFHVSTDSELSMWIRSQRVLYRHYRQDKQGDRRGGDDSCNGCYMQVRIQLMDDIGFDWDGRKSMEFRRNETWWKTFEEFKGFHKSFGHLDVRGVVRNASMEIEYHQHSGDFNVVKLDQWVKTQRSLYKRYVTSNGDNTTLTDDRICALSGLGGFIWNQHNDQWQKKFQDLKSFDQTYGHFNVPTVKPCPEGALTYEHEMKDVDKCEVWDNVVQLGRWARGQRVTFRKYNRNVDLPPTIRSRMLQLDEIRFLKLPEVADDCISAARGASAEEKKQIWDRHFSTLEQFQAENGHCFVSGDNDPKYKVLHDWVSLQRRRFRIIIKNADQNRHVADIELERLEKLNNLGFIWNHHDYKFQSSLNRLKEYANTFGHARVPPRYEEDPHLYTFVRKQRELYRARKLKGATNSLSEERIRELDDVGFVWCPRECTRSVE